MLGRTGKSKQNFPIFFPSPGEIVRGAQSWVGAMGCKEVPLDFGGFVVTHLERLAPLVSLKVGGNEGLAAAPYYAPRDPGWSESWVIQMGVPKTRCGLGP